MNYEAFIYYLHGWIQAIELLLVIWFVVWAGSHALDFYRAGMERVRRLEEREGKR
jgi:hypothetical protein